jgi:hypothetical protein
MPSRIQTLFSEFLEVLLLVTQPLSSVPGLDVNHNTPKSRMQEYSAQASFLRSILDPALIEQEVYHQIFDPSGLFRCIGATLKGHCAQMRDNAVEAMVQAAQTYGPGRAGSTTDAIKAVRMCMDILELMKLVRNNYSLVHVQYVLDFNAPQDIANHRLQILRPFLMRTSGQFEPMSFNGRQGSDCSLQITREWLRTGPTFNSQDHFAKWPEDPLDDNASKWPENRNRNSQANRFVVS